MPRDLETLAREESISTMPELTKSPEAVDDQSPSSSTSMNAKDEEALLEALSYQRDPKRDELHPYVQVLTESDVDSCTQVEQEAFPPQERCTREKFSYRLRTCGHLSLGIFTSHDPTTSSLTLDPPPSTTSTSSAVYSGHPSRKAVLIGLICATLSTHPTVTDEAMTLPTPAHPSPAYGHDPAGRTLCLHSLAILPAFQRRGLGRTLLQAYLQRMRDAHVADRVALIAHEALLTYYEGFGFRSLGHSKAQFGGGGWWDMVLDFGGQSMGEGVVVEADELEVGV